MSASTTFFPFNTSVSVFFLDCVHQVDLNKAYLECIAMWVWC